MKGNQPLETLAALCGGATKARTDDISVSLTSSTCSSSASTTHNGAAPKLTEHRPAVTPAAPPPTSAPLLPSPLENVPAVAPHTVDPNYAAQQQQQQQQQQWQSMAAAYGPNAAATAAAATAILQAASAVSGAAHAPPPPQPDQNAISAMQQMAYYQYFQAQAVAAQAQQAAQLVDGKTGAPVAPYIDSNAAMKAYTYAHPPPAAPQSHVHTMDPTKRTIGQLPPPPAPAAPAPSQPASAPPPAPQQVHSTLQVIPGPNSSSNNNSNSTTTGTPLPAAPNSMQPPPPPSQMPAMQSALSTSGILLSQPAQHSRPLAPSATTKIMPLKPPHPSTLAQRPDNTVTSGVVDMDDKKQQKRAANRRSAQLSRKRKKQFIEELKEENDELRRKEQILKSIPDLIVVFDSAGRLGFVSHSVSRFIDFSPQELEGSSFWNRLCQDSVRLLKAAFMDALAARNSDSDTTPLGAGVWELRLVDKDGSHKVITLNGVVHFSGEAPECVCSIRPRDDKVNKQEQQKPTKIMRPTIQPQQSVITSSSSSSSSSSPTTTTTATATSPTDSSSAGKAPQANPPPVPAGNVPSNGTKRAAQISDGDSGSVVSESGSE